MKIKSVKGFIVVKGDENWYEVGPWVVEPGCKNWRGMLQKSVFAIPPKSTVDIFVPAPNHRITSLLDSIGYTMQILITCQCFMVMIGLMNPIFVQEAEATKVEILQHILEEKRKFLVSDSKKCRIIHLWTYSLFRYTSWSCKIICFF